MPRAPLPSEAAAESDGHGVPCCSQAAQALHSGLEASAGPSHPAGQHASHEAPPPPEAPPLPVAEIRPLLSTDSPSICRYVLQAEAEFMQVPESPVHISQLSIIVPVSVPGQLL